MAERLNARIKAAIDRINQLLPMVFAAGSFVQIRNCEHLKKLFASRIIITNRCENRAEITSPKDTSRQAGFPNRQNRFHPLKPPIHPASEEIPQASIRGDPSGKHLGRSFRPAALLWAKKARGLS